MSIDMAVAIARSANDAAPIFSANGWEYAVGDFRDGERVVPNAAHLAVAIHDLHLSALRSWKASGDKSGSCGSGRFSVLIDTDEDGETTTTVLLELFSHTTTPKA